MSRSPRPARQPALHRRRRFHPGAEGLEGRALLTAGAFDPSFGGVGYVYQSATVETSKSASSDYGETVHALGDRSILVAGGLGSNMHAGVVKLTPAGLPDGSFGSGGRLTTTFFTNGYSDSVVQPDGKIILVGGVQSLKLKGMGSPQRDYDFAAIRYNANGSLDTTFGQGGMVVTNISTHQATDGSNRADGAYAAALQPDGKLLIAGRSATGPGPEYDPSLVRYNANGSLDTTFGQGGKVVTPLGSGGYDAIWALAVQADGKLLAWGSQDGASGRSAFLARYDAGGALDATFGHAGIVVVDQAAGGYGMGGIQHRGGLAVLDDGSIVIASSTRLVQPGNVLLMRYTPDGQLDSSFGSSGLATADLGGNERVTALVVQPDGKLVVSGKVYNTGGADAPFLMRFLADGSPDPAFGTGGHVLPRFAGDARDIISDLAIDPDGKIVAAGTAYVPQGRATNVQYLVARFLGDSDSWGAMSATYGSGSGASTAAGDGTSLPTWDLGDGDLTEPASDLFQAGKKRPRPGA